MHRTLITSLNQWKNRSSRLPLLLEGARQTGKTTLLEQFGRSFARFHRFDFVEDPALSDLFKGRLSPSSVLEELSLYSDTDINPDADLIVFDEIQHCPRALSALKYFAEQMPNAYVCASGSLLGIGLSHDLFPVGKVHRLSLRPFSFHEFLLGCNEQKLADRLQHYDASTPISAPIHEKSWRLLKDYFVVGGMPAAINAFKHGMSTSRRQGFAAARAVQTDLLKDYLDDISKHAGKIKSTKIAAVFKAVPQSLARESTGSKKFIFKDVLPGRVSYQELEAPIEWLLRAGLVHKVPICEDASPPLGANVNERRFKLYLSDVGLLGAMMNIAPEVIYGYDFGTFKGYFAENFVLQELSYLNVAPSSWARNTSEVEFLIENNGKPVPIEVKSGMNAKAKSLNVFLSRYHPEYAFLLSARPVQIHDFLPIQIPMYLTSRLPVLMA